MGEFQRKRVGEDHEIPSKRRPSPIRFEPSTLKETAKKQAVTIYSPPKDKFSKRFANGSGFDDYQHSKKSGNRSQRGRKYGQGSWRD